MTPDLAIERPSGAVAPAGGVSSLGRPALAAIRLGARADGVAYVARLIELALEQLSAPARIAELAPRSSTGPTAAEQFRFLARLISLEAREVDWVLFSHLGLARAQRGVPRLWRKPHAVFLHGIEAWDAQLAPDRKGALRTARLRIANSSHTARRAAEVHPDVGPIVACPLGLYPEHPGTGGASRGIPNCSVVIIGRMSDEERYKGHDELIESWPAVLRSVPSAQLVIVGTGNDCDRLRRKASVAQLGDRVLFTGFVDDATRDALLEQAAIFAMPSRGEGFGIVYLQAMKAGTPCVGSIADAAGDVIVDGETGRLVDPGKREQLAAAIVSLLQNDDLRRRMGAAGRRRFEAEFTFERFRDRLGGILAGAFGNSRERR